VEPAPYPSIGHRVLTSYFQYAVRNNFLQLQFDPIYIMPLAAKDQQYQQNGGYQLHYAKNFVQAWKYKDLN
jgi:hypothetical protein